MPSNPSEDDYPVGARPGVPDDTRSITIVGSGWRFASGISHYTCRLANSLAGERVSVIQMRRIIPRFLYPGRERVGRPGFAQPYDPRVSVFDGVDWFWLPSLIGAIRFLIRQRPDVVVFEWWTGAVLHTYLVLAWVARRLGSKVVIEFHEVQDTGEARIRGVAGYVALLGRRFFLAANGFVVHSEFDRREISAAFSLGNRPVSVIAHGPFDHHVGSAPNLVASEHDDFIVLFFGTIRPYKGLEHLVQAFDSLSDTDVQGMRLVVVGETWENWTLPLELIAESRHRDRIDVVNRYVSDAEVSHFFAAADAVALPYVRSSASGPLHIAMAYGLPIILGDVGGLRDGADGYDGVFWVPPSDVSRIAEALLEVRRYGGERYVDPRSWDATARSFDALFAAVQRR